MGRADSKGLGFRIQDTRCKVYLDPTKQEPFCLFRVLGYSRQAEVFRSTIEALITVYTVFGAAYYKYSTIYSKTLFSLF